MDLISRLKCPPGQFWYKQTEGIERIFEATPLIESLAAQVSDFRKGNKLPRATKGEALDDIIVFTCNRLGNDKQWCYDPGAALVQVAPVSAPSPKPSAKAYAQQAATTPIQVNPPSRGCATCGARMRK